MVLRELYGGALQAELPECFVDVSKVREVPDHQEVFTDVDTDQCMIVELLSMAADVGQGEDAVLTFHHRELARNNDAAGPGQCKVVSTRRLGPEDVPCIPQEAISYGGVLLSKQMVAKFREQARNEVEVYLAVLRLPTVTTDLLVSLSRPVHVDSNSSSHETMRAGALGPEPMQTFTTLLRTLKINNWGLFM
mmetsp:Transcript_4567/g.16069  ORF Transcript_4567/g.16069 Transcript_4567/m.16069 type:complete len:192 (+) Transcript_4567:104-679(+)|eukprot:CAMPEP_0114622670 /NCGR_PEP_ID=MMETSP0168-20121206/9856_1 /TAXON_ID=95228 ORGANISM="Vannella sp., Strain DIVA3 517/6/12" /NCGR_SAMPLE_ID=MMETSP0168 /ASSEMBLY_ACC=CAM_ASM_000044 /LENGTH=191 /DNA_ID=CAMNT_0001833891 /DNA_START=31 /DNA_END=606 /DNA_ORIENTATION=+